MIDIVKKEDCCGCESCVQRCPKNCIAMNKDKEGFLYPKVNQKLCIDCGLCEKVCPVINQFKQREPLIVYAAKNINEEIRKQSSSGGVFTLLAEDVIESDGVVFGAKFNEKWEVIHDYTETKQGLTDFRGSKYVQSRIGSTYITAEQFLKEGRIVLYSGSPCQIAGLKHYLKKDYEKLLTVDIICHGVPSPAIWNSYIEDFVSKKSLDISVINKISFRDKKNGWKRFGLSITSVNEVREETRFYEDLKTNVFLKGFLADLYLRPSCYSCPTKCLKSNSDLTLGDFWGVQNILPDIDDDQGVSVICVNSRKFVESFKRNIELKKVFYTDVIKYNPAIIQSAYLPQNRDKFWQGYPKVGLTYMIDKLTKRSLVNRIKAKIKSIVIALVRK